MTTMSRGAWRHLLRGTPSRKGHPGCVPFDEIVANVYSRAANQCAGYHTDQSELLGATSNILSEDKLAALEEEVAKLRLRVAELEEHSSGAATG